MFHGATAFDGAVICGFSNLFVISNNMNAKCSCAPPVGGSMVGRDAMTLVAGAAPVGDTIMFVMQMVLVAGAAPVGDAMTERVVDGAGRRCSSCW
eukprot:1143459-Pelagomonas_calceolata.AAC.1